MTSSRQERRASDLMTRRAARRGLDRPARKAYAGFAAAVIVSGAFLWWQIASRVPAREGAPAWSPDGRQIAFYAERDGHADLFVMNADGSGRRPLTTTTADEGAPAFSPDGSQIAFDTDRDRNFEIYTMDVKDSSLRRLTNDPARDLSPAWSPDGRRLAFMSDRDARPNFDVYVMNADGSGVRRLTSSASGWFPQFSPDSRSIALHVGRDVHILDVATLGLRRLTYDPDNGMYPTWSPDGQRLAFMSWRHGKTEIMTMNADGSGQQVAVSLAQGSAIDPRWSPDGSRLAFVQVPEASVRENQTDALERVIFVVELQTGKMTRLSRP